MKQLDTTLFGKPGYLKITEYLADSQKKDLGWCLPLGLFERLHFFMMRMFLKFSWFSDRLYILHPCNESPRYTALLNFFKKRGLYDMCVERSMAYPGIHSFYLAKNVLFNDKPNYINAQGVADTAEVALSKALGEMFERMITGLWDQNKNIYNASVTELRQKKVALYYPPDWHDFLPKQKAKFPELQHRPDDQVRWVVGKSLTTGEKVFLPRQVTSWFEGNRNSKKIFLNSTTNGSAAYFTYDGALVRGLLEVVQRDGFFVHWLTKTVPKVIDQASLPMDLREKVARFASLGVAITILDITSLNIPCVCIVAETRSARVPSVAVSAAADTTYQAAIAEALREMIGGIEPFYRAHLVPLEDLTKIDIFSLNKITRQTYWRGDQALTNIQWFTSGEVAGLDTLERGTGSTAEINDTAKLAAVIKILQEFGHGYEPIVYEPIHPLTKEVGMYVVQTYIPKAFPLYLHEKYGTFASPRLGDFHFTKKGVRNFTLNTEPHMFS